MEQKKTKTTKHNWTLSDSIIFLFQLIASGVFLYITNKLLPLKYWMLLTVILSFIILIFAVKINSYAKKSALFRGKKIELRFQTKKWILKLLSVIMSIVFLCISFFAGKGLSTLSNITGETHQTHLINIVVRKDSPYETINDLDGKSMGYAKGSEENLIHELLDQMEKTEKITPYTTIYDTNSDLAKALLQGETEAILLSEAYRGIIEDDYPNFATETRILYDYEIKEELKRKDTNINVTKEPFNIYITGIDTYGKVSTVSRTDVNMIVTVNPKTKQILMTSIPRDYYVELASFGVKDKLTHSGIYGVEESMSTLEQEFGISLHYYARVNFTSLITIVDALDGVDVYNSQSFTSNVDGKYYPKGEMHLNGKQALAFVRERYDLANGDHDRVKNQQKVLTAMLKKAMSPAIITNYSDLLNAASGSFTTNMSAQNIQSIIQMQINDMASWEFTQISVNGTGARSTKCYSMPGQSVYVMKPDYDSVTSAVNKINEIMNAK